MVIIVANIKSYYNQKLCSKHNKSLFKYNYNKYNLVENKQIYISFKQQTNITIDTKIE